MPRMIVEVNECVGCDREFGPNLAYAGAGKCHRCASGRAAPTFVPLETAVEEYRFARDNGIAVRDVVKRLGMTDKTFAKAMSRARKKGDERVADYTGLGTPRGNRTGKSFRAGRST